MKKKDQEYYSDLILKLGSKDINLLTFNEKKELARAYQRKALSFDILEQLSLGVMKYEYCDEIVQMFNQAIALDPQPEYFYQKVKYLLNKIELDETLTLAVHHANKKNAFFWDEVADKLFDFKAIYVELIYTISEAIDKESNYSSALHLRAKLFNHTKKYLMAISDIEKALVVEPNNSEYYETMYESLFALNKYQEALDAINKALNLDKNYDCNYISVFKKLICFDRMELWGEADKFIAIWVEEYLRNNPNLFELPSSNLSSVVTKLVKMKGYHIAESLLINLPTHDHIMEELIELYEDNHYEFLSKLDLVSFSLDLRGYWVIFWSCINLGMLDKATTILSYIEFDKQIPIEILEICCQRHDLFHLLKELEQPFSKLSLDLYGKLISKTIPGERIEEMIAKKLIDLENIWNTNNYYKDIVQLLGNEYYSISIKLALLDKISDLVSKLKPYETMSFYMMQDKIKENLNLALQSILVIKGQTEERNRIMANLSHSIKNMLRSVIDPLLLIKKEIPEKAKVIDDALKGANLIREIVNAINLSYKTTLEDLTYDIAHHGKDSVSLNEMIVNSLKYSIGNMFDDKYFPQYMEKYFPKKDAYQQANADWNKISGTNSITDIAEFADQYMFKLKFDGSEVANYMIGNEKSSAIKLMILFQEIIFNAVKYSCYVPKSKRHIEISLTEHNNKLSFKVVNSYNSKVQPKSTGVGKLIIENFAKVLGCEPVISTENEIYSITMEFKDYWREK